MQNLLKNPFHPGEMLLEEFLKPERIAPDGVRETDWLDARASMSLSRAGAA